MSRTNNGLVFSFSSMNICESNKLILFLHVETKNYIYVCVCVYVTHQQVIEVVDRISKLSVSHNLFPEAF